MIEFTNASPIISPDNTSFYNIFNMTEIISGSLVFNAVLIGIINYGITGKILD